MAKIVGTVSLWLLVLTPQIIFCTGQGKAPYEPTWESLDARPLPSWYDEIKVGIFIHWGVFSVPSFGDEWFWFSWASGYDAEVNFMKQTYPPGFTYQDFGPQFTAEFYDPNQWADLFHRAGAKYIVLTTKHHEGYTMWPSKYSFSWNSKDVGAHRDLVGELTDAIRAKTDLKVGLYHSLFEWFNPLWLSDKENGFTTDHFVQQKTLPELFELVNVYKPDIVWSDGGIQASDDYWKSKEFLAWLYNESPVKETVIANDRWGNGTSCHHGGYRTCVDRYNPGILQPHKWENAMTLDTKSFGYRRNAKIEEYLTPDELIEVLVQTVSCGGNLLVNIGPTKEGQIIPIEQERLLQLGEWLGINGDAIYGSRPWTVQNDTLTKGVWYTTNESRKQIYAITLDWPGQQLELGAVNQSEVNIVSIEMLGSSDTLTWSVGSPSGIKVNMPEMDKIKSQWAWTIVINFS